jgi:hypothetical protein
MVTIGQGAFKITYWAVEPNNIFPTFDFRRTPLTISSAYFEVRLFANNIAIMLKYLKLSLTVASWLTKCMNYAISLQSI